MRWVLAFFGILLTIPLHVIAQSDIPEYMEELMVNFTETSDLEPNEEEVTAYQNQQERVNINLMDPTVLSRIPFLTSSQIKNLTEYLTEYGEVFSLYELQAVEGFDSAIIQKLTPYIVIGLPPPRVRLTPRNLIREGRHEVAFRYEQVMQKQSGYQKGDSITASDPGSFYLGSQQRYYFRYRYTFFDQVVIGISGDKDAGEQFFAGSQPAGMDFYSGFLAIRNIKWLKQVIIGHFRASFGQGLTLGGSSFGSAISIGTAMHYSAGFSPSQSVCEYGYLRGAAVTLSSGNFECSGFLSTTRKDASVYLADTTENHNLFFTSFTETGYHRTSTELARKNQIREQVYGGHVSYRGGFFLVGLTGFYGTWSGSLLPGQEAYRQFMLEGNEFGGIGIDGRCRIGFSQVFGELSFSLNGGRAWLVGASVVPVSGMDLLMICRSYQPQYQNPFSTAVSQNSRSSNEQGFYLRLQAQLIPKATISGFVDLFRFPWLQYRTNSPSEGIEAGLFTHYQFNSFWSFSLRYSFKAGVVNASSPVDKITSLAEEKKNDLKAECGFSPVSSLSFRTCLSLRSYNTAANPLEIGYLASQEATYKRAGILRSVRLKYTLFDAPYYNARIYSYEPDLLYSFSAPVCYGKGIRCVLVVQLGVARKLDVWGYLGMIKYLDRSTIGSGMEEIRGSLKSEVKVQLRMRL
ncbi:MAG: helix-hairpin-helix domain-containing protein [Bacteroidales bacterium]|nr:helix-hairpin-helix domain-containing protein [Bacteroidales bacterium]